jgi:hypothetical protein
MKQRKFLLAVLLGALVVSGNARGQIIYQKLNFSIFGQYVTNEAVTNSVNPLNVNSTNVIRTVLITTASLVRAAALDFAGSPGYTNWIGSYLLREINLTNGAEGIFLYHVSDPVTNYNISRFFHGSYSNDFAYEPALTSHFAGITNLPQVTSPFYPANFSPTNNPIVGDQVYFRPTEIVTNAWTGSGLYYVEFYSTNISFNLLGYGTTTSIEPVERLDGVPYTNFVSTLGVAGIGTYALNNASAPTNGVVTGTNLYLISGPAHGSFDSTTAGYDPLFRFTP